MAKAQGSKDQRPVGYFDKRCSGRPGTPAAKVDREATRSQGGGEHTRDVNNTQTLYPANAADAPHAKRQEAKVVGALFLALRRANTLHCTHRAPCIGDFEPVKFISQGHSTGPFSNKGPRKTRALLQPAR